MSSLHEDTAGLFALETDKISKHFGAVRAVDQLSLSIPREGVTSIVGPNGSGKSTLVNLLSGTLPLDGGLVIIDGVGLKIVKAYETPGHGLTRTFQEVRLFDQISVWDNIMGGPDRAPPASRVVAADQVQPPGESPKGARDGGGCGKSATPWQ